MNPVQDACAAAAANVRQVINPDREFPHNVFAGDWGEFLFFDSDWMFAPEFVEHVKAFLEVDRATCACMLSLDPAAEARAAGLESFCMDRWTTPDAYQVKLGGPTPGTGWIHNFGRFGCASDKGVWCMYGDRSSEIAVIAFRRPGVAERYGLAVAQFHALPIAEAIAEPMSYGFSARALSTAWRNEFLREYARGRSG